MKSWSTPVGLVLVLVGLVWTAQGIGWLEGSPMTDETLWAVLGPVVALAGVVLAVLGLRGKGADGDA
jgi:hypothetical protein